MKKGLRYIISTILTAVIVLAACISPVCAAPEIDKDTVDLCKAWMLVDATSGSVIAKSDTYQDKISPASTTKILTAIIALDKCEMDDVVKVDSRATMLGADSSKCGLVAGEKVTVEDLLYGMMLVSGNDAALALAYHISGGIDDFAKLMNEKAAEIGMENSHFANPHGLDNDEHYVTCEDMAKLALYAMGYDDFMKICATKSYKLPKTENSVERLIYSTNKLIYKPDSDSVSFVYKYATGMKTGSTYRGGGCLVATGEKDGQKLVACVFGDPTEGGVNRWRIAKYLLEYGFNNYTTITVADKMQGIEVYADIQDASDPELTAKVKLDVKLPDDLVITLDNDDLGDSPEFTYKIESEGTIKTPFSKGEAAATVKYYYGGNEVYSCTGYFAQSLQSVAEAQGKEGIVTTIDTEKISKEETVKDYSKLWLWLVIPGAALVFIVIRMLIKNHRPKRRYAKHTAPARMPGYRRSRRRTRTASPRKLRRRTRGANLRNTRVSTRTSGRSRRYR